MELGDAYKKLMAKSHKTQNFSALRFSFYVIFTIFVRLCALLRKIYNFEIPKFGGGEIGGD